MATTLLTRTRDSHQNHSSAVDGWLNRIESYLLDNISSSWVKEANKEILRIVSATLLTRARKPLSAKDGSIEWSGINHHCPISCNTVKTNIGAPRFGLDLQNKHFSARPWRARKVGWWVGGLGGKKARTKKLFSSRALNTPLSPQPNRFSLDSSKSSIFGPVWVLFVNFDQTPAFSPQEG